MEQMSRAIPLDTIVDRVAPIVALGDSSAVSITGVAFDDSKVAPGSLYCCLPGARVDGHEFAARARRAGAVAFICEHSLGTDAEGAVQLVVGPGEARSAMARAACAFYRDPAASLRTVGVTGTNGKTTTTYLLRAILERNGWPTGVVGTLDGARTTPESPELQRVLAEFRDRGSVAAALEVTSHALVQGRVDGIRFDVAVFTNLSQDHLDFHETMEAYFAAKSKLFDPSRTRKAVVNADDDYGRRLAERASVETVTYSLGEATRLELAATSSRFELAGRPVELHLGGVFNVANALAAAAAARALGIGEDVIVAGLQSARGVPGRFETIESIDGVTVVVDYAHTPAALEQVLSSARAVLGSIEGQLVAGRASKARAQRLIVVFGAGGARDRGKRPAMGAIASQLADVVVLTSDNPRNEDPADIADQLLAGVQGGTDSHVELDRRAAIGWALSAARAGDVVVVAGKGHETTQEFADATVGFDDREVVREELERQGRALPAWARPASARGRT
ncbi:MAG: murE [Acidimicrobiaceae bacterium]|nr:murE [Acidimicrobiaceae bacterium]